MRKLFLGVFVLLLTVGCAKEPAPQSKPVPESESSADGDSMQEDTAQEKAVSWDLSETYTVTKLDFRFYAHLSKDGDGYCRDNSKIKTMTLPATVTEIDPTAFSGMRALTKLDIPDNVKVLNAETFYGCSGLREVKLPENLSEISSI